MATDQTRTTLTPSAAAETVLAFVNTRAIDGTREEFLDGAAFAQWLRLQNLTDTAALVTDADAAAARELRDALVRVLLAHAGEGDLPGRAAAEEYLHRSAELYPLAPVITASGVRLEPTRGGVPGALATMLAAASDVAMRGSWMRLKACRNPPCHLAFYDRTRNSSAAYCSPNRCGAQVAMRSYRSRKAKEEGG
ncbi:CGNR zinc finger domain-containing protein [Kitasatospora sp. NPDC057015]|uniref:CGNR zinc finger domain-containing protein n=1 Tax=Kitasatospora sp. NPDC057015 TaxID=3346001 RepID=UPI003630A9B0